MILILVEFGLRPGAEAPPCRDHRCRRSGIFVPHGRLISVKPLLQDGLNGRVTALPEK